MTSWLSDKAALMRPTAPAAATRWPMLLFTEEMAQNWRSWVPSRNASVSASISMGSPMGVAVPWLST